MGFIELFLIGIGLSMDAFAVAICKGLNMKKINYNHTFTIALFFGGFQGLMPLLGWFLGMRFEKYITSIDHWISFLLLLIIGANMIRESFKSEPCTECNTDVPNINNNHLNIKELLLLSIATSIDALAVGITFAFLKVNIVKAIIIIGLTTFVLSFIGVILGNLFGSKYKNKATFIGGAVLILIGIKILLDHLLVR